MKIVFDASWFAPSEQTIPDKGKLAPSGKPMRVFSGKLFRKFNQNDTRTVYEFTDEEIAKLPKTARPLDREDQAAMDRARAPIVPITIHEARIAQGGITNLERLADLAQEEQDVGAARAAVKAELKATRLANLAKGREKAKAKKLAEAELKQSA